MTVIRGGVVHNETGDVVLELTDARKVYEILRDEYDKYYEKGTYSAFRFDSIGVGWNKEVVKDPHNLKVLRSKYNIFKVQENVDRLEKQLKFVESCKSKIPKSDDAEFYEYLLNLVDIDLESVETELNNVKSSLRMDKINLSKLISQRT